MINRENKKLVDEYLEYRSRYNDMDPKSIRLEHSLSLHYLTWAGEKSFKSAPNFPITLKTYLEEYRQPNGKNLSQQYRRKIICSAKMFFTWLMVHKKGFRSITPTWLDTLRVRIRQDEFDDVKTLLLTDILQIARTPVSNLVEERVRSGAVFLYLSGMRINAFVSMPIQAVNLSKLTVHQSPRACYELW